MSKRIFILQKDIIIKAGTQFDNLSNEAERDGVFECVVGIGKDAAEIFQIKDMEEILKVEPTFFKEQEF
jgi:hypothetical protein